MFEAEGIPPEIYALPYLVIYPLQEGAFHNSLPYLGIYTQCARSLILREKWGVVSLIISMYFQHLGTISSHSRAKLVPLDLLLGNHGGYQTEKSSFLLLKWLILKKCHCATLCRDTTYVGSLQMFIGVTCQNIQPSGALPKLLFSVPYSGHKSLPHFQQNQPFCTL